MKKSLSRSLRKNVTRILKESSSEEVTTLKIHFRQKQTPKTHFTGESNKQVHVTKQTLQTRWVPKKLMEAQQGSRLMWIPKQQYSHDNKDDKSTPKQRIPKSATNKSEYNKRQRFTKLRTFTVEIKTSLRWIPKKSLQAQGYYNGAKKLWIPKKNTQINDLAYQTEVSMTAAPVKEHCLKLTREQKGKWVPRQLQHRDVSTLCQSKTSTSTPEDKSLNKVTESIKEEKRSASINDSTLKLQVTLFGMDYHNVFTKMKSILLTDVNSAIRTTQGN